MREQVDESIEAKNEVFRQVAKANQEIQQWRSKFESEGKQEMLQF
jgi:myosin heavy chain 6/7